MYKFMITAVDFHLDGVGWVSMKQYEGRSAHDCKCVIDNIENYRVEQITENEYFMYDPNEPEYRLKVERIQLS